MQAANGKSSLATGLGTIDLVGPLTPARFLFLFGLGALSVVLHKTFNYPLHLPGHHGLEIMALFVLGRLTCTHRFAATIVAISAAATAGATGAEHNPVSALLNILPGLGLDLALMAIPGWRTHLWVLPLLSGLAYALKPLARFGIAEVSGMPFGSLRYGVLYPVETHFAYALTGALIAVALWRITAWRLEGR